MWQQILTGVKQGDARLLARAISLVENEVEGYLDFMKSLAASHTMVIGLTGPPGAGKSTLADALIGEMVSRGKKVGVLCVDPSSPFNLGALLGDRIRMSQWYQHPGVFIRSLANRGSLGGLHPKIIELTDVMKAAPFDYVIVETVGVGQSEVEIAGLADTTIVVLVPEGGDEVQTMKAGVMEIADVFVVNKADRPGADAFVANLKQMLRPTRGAEKMIPVLKTVAASNEGVGELYETIADQLSSAAVNSRRSWLLAEKAWHLVQQERMRNIDKQALRSKIEVAIQTADNFNLYRFIEQEI